MPPVVKQTLPGNRNGSPPKQSGSVLGWAIDVGDLTAGPVKFAVYGQNRVGKTTLLCTFPKPLLIISFEPDRTGGADSVKGVKGVKLIRPRTIDEYKTLMRELATTDHGFETVGLDSCTSLQDAVLRKLIGAEDDPTLVRFGSINRQVYMDRAEETRNLLRPLLNLDCNVVVTGKEKDHTPAQSEDKTPKIVRANQVTIESFFSFDLGSGTAGWLADCCGCIGRLYLARETVTTETKFQGKTIRKEEETGKYVRRLLTQLHPNFAAGVRAADPTKVPEYVDNPDYAKIRSIMDGTYSV